MPPGSVLGLTAKLGVDTDDQQIERETRSLTDKITEAAEAEMSTDVSTLKSDIVQAIEEASHEAKWLPSMDLGKSAETQFDDASRGRLERQMESLGKEVHADRMGMAPGADTDDGLGGELLSGMKGAGGKFLKVGLAGAVGLGILSKITSLADAAPRMQKTMSMIGRSIGLFARPFYDALAQYIEPYAEAGLEYMARFNQEYAENGLPVAIVSLAEDVVTKGGQAEGIHAAGRGVGLGLGFLSGGIAGGKAGAKIGGTIGSAGGPAGAAVGAVGGSIAGALIGLLVGDRAGQWGEDLMQEFRDATWEDYVAEAIGAKVERMSGLMAPPGGFGEGGEFIPRLVRAILEEYEVGNRIEESIDEFSFSAVVQVIRDQWPGWGAFIPDVEWNIPGVDDVLGEVGESIPTLDWYVPGYGDLYEWITRHIDDLDWYVPAYSDLHAWTTRYIDDLDWYVPEYGDLSQWVRSHISDLTWNVPSSSRILNVIESKIPEFNWDGYDVPSGGDGDDGIIPGFDLDGGDVPSWGDDDGLSPFATGGLVTSPTAALVGEAGPEVVAPFSEFMEAVNAPERRFGGGGGGRSSGGSDASVDRVVDAIDELKHEIKRLDPQTELKIDRRTLAKEEQKSRTRYRDSKVVTR